VANCHLFLSIDSGENPMMEPVFFENQADLRSWFEKNHLRETELLVGYYTVKSKRKSVTWSQSVDEAICFGWIDGIRRSIDGERYCIRFTPRRPGSNWSKVNIIKAKELSDKGLMHPAGYEAYGNRKPSDLGLYSYEPGNSIGLDKELSDLFQRNRKAWDYFSNETASYRKITTRWIMSAKREATRLGRCNELITSCEKGERIRAMRWGSKGKKK
jgi:uncharacterized protein YdeI (YjbR/CyaY-like superfamily)